MLKEFKEFIMRGNVLDLAIAVIMGAAFAPIISSLVNDILMPPIGLLLGGLDFKDLFVNLTRQPYPSLAAAKAAGVPVIAYGVFLNTLVNFLIVSFSIFLLVRQVNRLRKPAAPEAPATKVCSYCLSVVALGASRCPHCTSDLKTA
jgi:large conductance mechanosensitive channel